MTSLYSVKNWADFQHYKDRSPSWIKLHKNLLDDFDFQCLPVASKALAPMLWLLASEYQDPVSGSIEGSNEKISFRLRMSVNDFLEAIKPLIEKGFIISASKLLATPEQDASPEKERESETYRKESEEETETDTRAEIPLATPSNGNGHDKPKSKRTRKSSTHIDDKFSPDLDGLKLASDLEIPIDNSVREFVDYWKSVGKPMCDWQAAFRNRLRQLAKYRAANAQRQSGGRSNVRDVAGATLRARTIREQAQAQA